MRKFGCLVAVFGLACALPGYADTVTYGWEDGVGTVLGMYPEGGVIPSNVTDPVHSGEHSLQLIDNAESGTPQAYIAWVVGLMDDDVVEAGFWRYDDTPGASPSCRIWAHWNDDPNDINGYAGSAGGNDDYGPGEGWDETTWSWTVAEGHTGIVIECRTYSIPGDTVWIDDMFVTAPEHATIYVVPEPSALALFGLGALSLLRRR